MKDSNTMMRTVLRGMIGGLLAAMITTTGVYATDSEAFTDLTNQTELPGTNQEVMTSAQTLPEEVDVLRQSAAKESAGAALSSLNCSEMFLEQPRSSTCTLTSVAMVLRRAAYLAGSESWQEVTVQAVEPDAWIYGLGIANSFESFGMTMENYALPGGSANKEALISLLEQHPEGIALYCSWVPHCIVLTDYTDGEFYCADTLDRTIGRMSIDAAYGVTIENATSYWAISSKSSALSDQKEDAPKLSDIDITELPNGDYVLTFRAEDESKVTAYLPVWNVEKPDEAAWITCQQYGDIYSAVISAEDHADGYYLGKIYAYDEYGNYSNELLEQCFVFETSES